MARTKSEWIEELQNNIFTMKARIEIVRRQQDWETVLYYESKIEECERLLKLAEE